VLLGSRVAIRIAAVVYAINNQILENMNQMRFPISRMEEGYW